MLKKLSCFAMLAFASTALTGCFDNDDDDTDEPVIVIEPPVTPPVTPPMGAEDDFGAGFAAAFRAPDFFPPTDPVDGDIVDIDKTIDPLDIENPS